MGVGFFAGSLLGLGIALVRTRSDRTLRSPGEAALHLQIRELGVIPSIRGRGLRLQLGSRAPQNPASAGAGAIVPARGFREILMGRMPAQSVALATWLRIPELAEAFTGIMDSLLLPGKNGSEAQVIVLTSPERGDGKSTVSINLAIAMALIGRRVVLVDGDLRKPHIQTVFPRTADSGLAKLLEGDAEIDKLPLSHFVSETQVPNLSVVTTNHVSEGISAKLHSSRMRQMLKRLREEFDTVVIDSPPMLHISDARVLGSLADGVILVLHAGKTTIESALAVRERLAQDDVPVLGVVLNEWSARKNEAYNGYSSYFRVA
jgi:capsular exopolysaccharide synthesis family protein